MIWASALMSSDLCCDPIHPFDEEPVSQKMRGDHVAANLVIEPDDFEYAPFAREGGLGKVHQLFGDQLQGMLATLNEGLAA
jgi:hypothetical protein